MSATLSPKEAENARFTFSIYDFDGTGGMDAFYLGPALRVMNLTPTLSTISKVGGAQRKGERELTPEEFLTIYAEVKSIKDSGTMEEFLECFRTNDKHRHGQISSSQLGHLLQAYGEKLEPEEVEDIIRDCGNPQNGIISYGPFLEKILSGPDMKKPHSRSFETPKDQLACQDGVENKAVAKVKKLQPRPRSVPDDIIPAEPQTPMLANAAFSLKTMKSRTTSVSEVEDAKKAATAAAEASLKPKNQMPLIAMKTKGLIGNIVKKEIKG